MRPRPFNVTDAIENVGNMVGEFSFPSGHAACATAIAIFLAIFFFKRYQQKWVRVCVVFSAIIFVFLVCLSRMYLGKHYLTDVLGGVAVSSFVTTLCLLLKWAVKKRGKNENKSTN